MKYHAIGYLIILAMLSGCAHLAAAPMLPEITIKIGPKPALVVEREVVSVEETP